MSNPHRYLAGVFAVLCTSAFAQTSTPVGYYPANGSGADISPGHHDATLPIPGVGESSYETGEGGQAFSFDGTNRYADLGDWFEKQSFTVGFWMKDTGTTQKDGAQVAGQYNFNKGTEYWKIVCTAAEGGHYEVRTNNGGAAIPFLITKGDWHYVILTRSGLNLRVFADGVLQGSATGTSNDSFAFNGGIRLGTDRNLQHQWKGALDEIRFYDRALDGFEIAALSKAGTDAEVAGTANPYLSGRAAGTVVDGDAAPAQAPVAIPVQEQQDLLISASGAVGTSGGTATGLPAGGNDITHAASGSIASYSGPGGALVGVFLGDSVPSGTAPVGLDYSASGSDDPGQHNNSPAIGQVFFIGDRQGAGEAAHFHVPQFATRLFLAAIDNGNSHNTGSFSAHIVNATAGGPYQRTIFGNSNIYGADFSAPPAEGFAPPSATFTASAGKVLTFSEVTGSVRIDTGNDNGGNGANPPDGGPYQAPVNVASSGGISGFKASSSGALVGVFLAGNSAPATAPSALDFTVANATDFTEISPQVGQVFFIGDGATSAGVSQKFNVPATATGLYLGLADGSTSGGAPGGYANNDGQFNATFGITSGSLVETGSAVLKISASDTTTSDPTGGIAHSGDDITYKFHWENSGTATARNLKVSVRIPTYIEDGTNLNKQFDLTQLTFNTTYGHFTPASGPTANDAMVVWDVSDLAPSYSQEVELKIHIHPTVRNVQQIALPNNYGVASTSSQPAAGATGFSSGAANLGVDIRSALRFTATPNVTTVAPGKYISYTLKLENQGPVAAPNAAAVFTIPDFTRFAGFALVGGVPAKTPPTGITAGVVPRSGGDDQLLIYFGNIAALNSVSLVVTVQAQWVDPTEVSGRKLSLLDYGAAFLSGSSVAKFQAAIRTPDSTDYFALIRNTANSTGLTFGGSGTVATTFQGSAANGPDIHFTKAIMNDANDTLNDGLGDAIDTVSPGDVITYSFLIANEGKSQADDVFIQDAMPSSTSYVAKSAKIITTTTSSKASTPVEPSVSNKNIQGQHIIFKGLSLAPKDFLVLQYQVRVASGASAPAIGSMLTTDSAVDPATGLRAASSAHTSSSPHTVSGLTISGPIQLTGDVVFAQPRVRPMLPNPEVSANVAATRTALDAIYASDVNATPLTKPKDVLSFVPGMERYYAHYENLSGGKVADVDLVIPIPAHTAFYRARFVNLDANPLSTADGIWPGKIDKTPSATAVLTTPAILSTGSSVKVHFGSLAKGEKGDVFVEVIIAPNAIQKSGSFAGATSDADVVIHDNPVATKGNPKPVKHSASVGIPLVKVAHSAAAGAAADFAGAAPAAAAIPIVPEVGILKVAPTVVNSGNGFEMTFVIFNSGDASTPACNFQLVQPAGTRFLRETHTTSNNGKFVVDGPSAKPGVDLECFWDKIPAHSAVAVTYSFAASAAANSQIVDTGDRMLMNYSGELHVTASPIGVTASNGGVSANETSTFSVTGHVLHEFTVSGVPVAIIDLGGGQVVVDEPVEMYGALGAGGVNEIAFGRTRGVFFGPAKSVGVGNTSASYLLTNRNHGALLSAFASSPVTTIVPAGCLELALPGELSLAAGAGLLPLPSSAKVVSNDGASLISQDGGTLISQDGGGLISQDGGAIISHDGGGIISHDGGGIITKSGAGLTSQANTISLVAAGGGNLIASGGGNLGPAGK